MKSRAFVVLLGTTAAFVLFLFVVVQSRRNKSDTERIQGEWKVTSYKVRGRSFQDLTGAVFKGDKVVFKSPTGRVTECAYRIDDDYKPAWLDLVAPQENMQGVYVLEGDILRISLNESSDGRATAFDPETGTAHKYAFVLERHPRN